ncbi:MAG: hypothetical protein M3Q26_05525, partial [Acidobacteriota bacterium]|nr:hypothetical protein [Acidobacteriota bacterium]
MKIAFLFALVFLVLSINMQAQTAAEFGKIWEKQHISNIFPSNVRHKNLKNYLDGLKKLGVNVVEAGRSFSDREIYQIEF